ncbi:MAG: hypothetical protein AAFR98_07410 [Pseudomonadota bacterium]
MSHKLIGFGLVALVALTGCEDMNLGSTQSEAPSGITQRILNGEIARPDVFNQTGNAVWDGRPTLGGVWVASKETQDLERVRVTRTDTGESIFAALFRIEPSTPGPSLVVSSDAARALGFIAGTPTEIEVVALRSQPEPEPAPSVAAATPSASADGDGTVEPTDSETTQAPTTQTAAEDETTAAAPAAVAASPSGDGLSEAVVDPTPVQPDAAQPVLEIGAFKTVEEADLALVKLASQGLTAQKVAQKGVFTSRWVVYAGPFETPNDMIEGRKAAAKAGFTDAIVTAR